jgi:4-amino-4-deoxy-L-arabinose transferase-like glycosyltransferase
VGLLLPLAVIGLFLLIVNRPPAADAPPPATWPGRAVRWLVGMVRPFAPGNVLRTTWQMRPLSGAMIVLAVALPWYILVGERTEGAWLQQFFMKYNLGPFVQPFMGHRGPFFYHFLVIFVGFFPWSVFFGPAMVHSVRRIRRRHAGQPGYILLVCWVGVFFVFWSACSTKLPHYVLPAYPPLALLCGCLLSDWLAEPARFSRWWPRNAAITLIVVGVGIAVAVPIVTAIFLPGEGVIGLVGLILVAGGGACLLFLQRGRPQATLQTFAVTSVLFLTGMFAFAAVRVDRHQHAPDLLAEIRRAEPPPAQVAAYRFLQPSIVFYAGGPVPCFEDAEQLDRFLGQSPQPCLVTTDDHVAELQGRFPGEFRVLARRPKFLGKGEVLVLARRPPADTPHTAATTTIRPR